MSKAKVEATHCQCNGHPCGVGKSYDEIFKSWSAHYMDRNFNLNDAERIHKKWKSLGKSITAPGASW